MRPVVSLLVNQESKKESKVYFYFTLLSATSLLLTFTLIYFTFMQTFLLLLSLTVLLFSNPGHTLKSDELFLFT